MLCREASGRSYPKKQQKADLRLSEGEAELLNSVGETGSGTARDRREVRWEEIIEQVNTLFESAASMTLTNSRYCSQL